MAVAIKYREQQIPVFTVPPDWSNAVGLRMLDKVLVRESLDVSEERIQTRPRPLYGLRYRTLTLSEQETGYIRRVLELPDGLPFALPVWPDQVKITAAVESGDVVIPVESTANSLWDTFDELAIVWTAFNTWELISVESVATNEIVLDTPLAGDWSSGAFVVPLMVGHLARNEYSNVTSDHATFNVDFQERYFTVDVETTASGEGSSGCCQTVGPYFRPGYDPITDRVGVGHRGPLVDRYGSAIIRLLSPECDGLLEIADTRVTGGGTFYETDEVIYLGVDGGASGDELIIVLETLTGSTQLIGGFPNPSGNARGLDCLYIASVDRVWMRVTGCGSDYAFAIIDPNTNTLESFVAHADLVECDQWEYCDANDSIYAACGSKLLKIDVTDSTVTQIDISSLGIAPVNLLLGGVTYTYTAPGNEGSGKIWFAYQNKGVVPNTYAIAILDPGADEIDTGIASLPRLATILWYGGAFDFVLSNGGASTNEIVLWNSDLTEGDPITGYQLTAKGTYADSQAKLCVPVVTNGEYCLAYFSGSSSGLSGSNGRLTQEGDQRITQAGGVRLTQA